MLNELSHAFCPVWRNERFSGQHCQVWRVVSILNQDTLVDSIGLTWLAKKETHLHTCTIFYIHLPCSHEHSLQLSHFFPLGPALVRRRRAWTERATGAAVEWRSELLSWPGRTMKNRWFFQTISSCNSKDSVILMCNLMCVIYDTIVPFSQLMWHTPIIALYCLFRTSLSQPCWGATQRHYTNIGHANLYLWLSAYVYCWVRFAVPAR